MTNNISLYASSLCSQLWKRNCKFFLLISTSEDSGNHAIKMTFRFDSDRLDRLLRRKVLLMEIMNRELFPRVFHCV